MILALVPAVLGVIALAIGIWNERMMQRHRRPGVSYRDVTFRSDGGWRRRELFSDEGLAYQRRASAFGFSGLMLLVIALVMRVVIPG